jgi:hypothetical protein
LGAILAATANGDGFGNQGCELSVDAIEFIFNTSSSEDKLKNEVALNIYPNPANGMLHVYMQGNNQKRNINLYDITGKLVYEEVFDKEKCSIHVSAFPEGMYFVKISGEKEQITRKVILGN